LPGFVLRLSDLLDCARSPRRGDSPVFVVEPARNAEFWYDLQKGNGSQMVAIETGERNRELFARP
jgi:hypothetical protein